MPGGSGVRNPLHIEPKEAEFEYIQLAQEGSWHRRGPPCFACEAPGHGGVIFGVPKGHEADYKDLPEGQEPCLTCGAIVDVTKNYGPKSFGPKVRVMFPPDSDDIAENPYLNPRAETGTWEDPAEVPIWSAPKTELGNALRLLFLYGDRIRHVHEWGFLVYDGRRWLRDNVGAMERFAKGTIWEMLRACDTITVGDKKEIASLREHAFKSQSAGQIRSMIALAASEPNVASRISDFDQHPWFFNCRNGVIDLTTGQLLPHDPKLNFTQVSQVEYDANALCPRWNTFVLEVCRGNQDLVDYIHRAVGYTLTGYTDEQVLFFLFGDGANGKSTFLEVIRALLGEYSVHLPFEAFLHSRNGRPESHLAPLPGKRFVTASEAGEGRSWNEELLKTVTGGDTIRGEYKYKDSFEFRPVAKIWVAANDRPMVHGANNGIWRRFHPVPFHADFKGRGDPNLLATLKAELPGILAWAVRGARRWREVGLQPPAIITEALEEYKTDNDVLSRFIAERCTLDNAFATPSSSMLEEFNEWAKRNHERPANATSMGNRLRKFRGGLLVKQRAPDGRIAWGGIRIASPYKDRDRASGLEAY